MTNEPFKTVILSIPKCEIEMDFCEVGPFPNMGVDIHTLVKLKDKHIGTKIDDSTYYFLRDILGKVIEEKTIEEQEDE
ncbi:hypothetical protein LCGC14_1554710 [marine sediment metagenome]|uniref:Uncharacterized protein n=1 Tax=marine sediment metagenome TaxID=412755 RepID=A0A0F9IP95_9ZZZZ